MGFEHTKPSYMREEADSHEISKPVPIERQIDKYFDASEQQVLFLVRNMRRVEELADRIAGAVPTEATNNDKPPHVEGIYGGLLSQNNDRETALIRISRALDRIEQVI